MAGKRTGKQVDIVTEARTLPGFSQKQVIENLRAYGWQDRQIKAVLTWALTLNLIPLRLNCFQNSTTSRNGFRLIITICEAFPSPSGL